MKRIEWKCFEIERLSETLTMGDSLKLWALSMLSIPALNQNGRRVHYGKVYPVNRSNYRNNIKIV
jgi:hypothetical protein